MKLQLKALSIALGAATLLVGSAWGEARIGIVSSTDTTPAQATARVSVSVSVPRFVYLRVGALGAGAEGLAFGVNGASILPYVVAANNQVVATGTVPTATFSATGAALTVQAYTNAGTGASLACTSSTTGGSSASLIANVPNQPKLTDFTVTPAGASPSHPGGASLTCGSPAPLSGMTVYNGTWTYSLATPGTPWTAGDYAVQVAYTASTI